MLKLENITKNYVAGDSVVEALKGVSIEFRKSEFVAILGASGCGKTTLLNIVGGLDKYTTGDLIINGRSTKKYVDHDWDTYRNHSVGFVFQSYNLIPHQTVLSNVELALTLSGISKEERKQRAIEALCKVGLEDQIYKKPNQLSGGQMQRVSIARAIVNDPDIILADEPTGALDSTTSIQVMDILKEIASDRLVVMVTHNPDLADKYANRIIRLTDGLVVSDSNPYESKPDEINEAIEKQSKKKKGKKKNSSMSFWTAFCLSLNNLLTKKARTLMVAFAGSIGIIGIALILSLSSGFQNYIDKVQEDTLSTYPITIEKNNMDMTAMVEAMVGANEKDDHDLDKVYSNDIMVNLFTSMLSKVYVNDLKSFKETIDNDTEFQSTLSAIKYSYDMNVNIYAADTNEKVLKVNPSNVFKDTLGPAMSQEIPVDTTLNVWSEMLDNKELLDSQYDVIHGSWPQNYNEVVLVVNDENEVSDYALYALGLKDPDELKGIMDKILNGQEVVSEQTNFTYEDICNVKFKLVLNPNLYEQEGKKWVNIENDKTKLKEVVDAGEEISVVGIIRPKENISATSITGTIAYTSDLTKHVIKKTSEHKLVQEQKNNPTIDSFTGLPFVKTKIDMEYVNEYLKTLTPEEKYFYDMMVQGKTDEEIIAMFESLVPNTNSTYEGNMKLLEACDISDPLFISLYPKDFAGKDYIEDYINNYNALHATEEGKEIRYTDYIGIMLSSISTIIDAISYVLIAFVSISLIVSSIMIGVITYISVLERTKEIGVLRSLGARKKDISSIFNAETLIIGLASGLLGVGVTVVLCIPINLIIDGLAGIGKIAKLPLAGGIILVVISMFLTFIAGLIPSRYAAKKDPVIALRTE